METIYDRFSILKVSSSRYYLSERGKSIIHHFKIILELSLSDLCLPEEEVDNKKPLSEPNRFLVSESLPLTILLLGFASLM